MNREPIYAAIFALVAGLSTGDAPSFVTRSRKLLHWSDVAASEMPALFQTQKRETANPKTGLPTKWDGGVDLYLYVSTSGDATPSQLLNPLLDQIDALFATDPGRGDQRLGGLVQWARIEGTIETSEGTLGDLEIAIVPIRFLTA